jgi:tetratricopeptide (TPR) repeat protein
VRLLILLTLAAAAAAQSPSFEELAARAQSLLDSKPAEAAAIYRQALKLRPDWAEGWMYCGAALYQSASYAEATDAFRKGIAIDPKKGTAWAFLGLAEAELDNADQAIADIRKGEEMGLANNPPFETAVRVRAAQLLVKGSAFDEAMGQLVPLAKRGEDTPAVEETMGLCALALPQAPAELTPERRAVVDLAGKAAWSFASQKPAVAAQAYRDLLSRYDKEPGVHYAYGLYLMETDLSAALAEFKKEVANDPQHWPALVVMGSTETRQGDAEAAVTALRQAMKLMPVKYRWIGHAELGRAELTGGSVAEAVTDLESALRQAPGNPQVHFFLAQAYRRAGRKDDAQRETAEFEKLKVEQDPLGVPGLRGFALK